LSLDGGEPTVAAIKELYKKLNSPGHAVDEDTYVLAVVLWMHLNDKVCRSGKPIKALKRILPAMINAWNRLKVVLTRKFSHLE
jgi:hypothetical protein